MSTSAAVDLVTPVPSILVLSTYAEDTMVYVETGEQDVKPGGPAYWIEQTYKRMNVPFEMLTGKQMVTVRMELVNGEPLPGKVITHGSKIIVEKDLVADGILINFLDDFEISQVLKLTGTILLDIAPYTRTGEFRNQRRNVDLPSRDIREKISIIKSNHEEYPYLPAEWIEEQKQERIFIHTLGARGLELWDRGTVTKFDPPKQKAKNMLGAGDTFGAAFLFKYLQSAGDANEACVAAIEEVGSLFATKPIC